MHFNAVALVAGASLGSALSLHRRAPHGDGSMPINATSIESTPHAPTLLPRDNIVWGKVHCVGTVPAGTWNAADFQSPTRQFGDKLNNSLFGKKHAGARDGYSLTVGRTSMYCCDPQRLTVTGEFCNSKELDEAKELVLGKCIGAKSGYIARDSVGWVHKRKHKVYGFGYGSIGEVLTSECSLSGIESLRKRSIPNEAPSDSDHDADAGNDSVDGVDDTRAAPNSPSATKTATNTDDHNSALNATVTEGAAPIPKILPRDLF